MKLTQFAALSTLVCTAFSTHAAPIWQDFSITGLYGKNYELIARKMTNRPLLLNMQPN